MYNKLQHLICSEPEINVRFNGLGVDEQAGKRSDENELRVVTYSDG